MDNLFPMPEDEKPRENYVELSPEDKRKVAVDRILNMSPEQLDRLQLELLTNSGEGAQLSSLFSEQTITEPLEKRKRIGETGRMLGRIASNIGTGNTDTSNVIDLETKRRLRNQDIERYNTRISDQNNEQRMNKLAAFLSSRKDDIVRGLAGDDEKELRQILLQRINQHDETTVFELMDLYADAFDEDPKDVSSRGARAKLKQRLIDLSPQAVTPGEMRKINEEKKQKEKELAPWEPALTNFRGLRANGLIVNLPKPPSILAVESFLGKSLAARNEFLSANGELDPEKVVQIREAIFESENVPQDVRVELRTLDAAHNAKTVFETQKEAEKERGLRRANAEQKFLKYDDVPNTIFNEAFRQYEQGQINDIQFEQILKENSLGPYTEDWRKQNVAEIGKLLTAGKNLLVSKDKGTKQAKGFELRLDAALRNNELVKSYFDVQNQYPTAKARMRDDLRNILEVADTTYIGIGGFETSSDIILKWMDALETGQMPDPPKSKE